MPVVIVLLVLIILAELFLLMLRCRREHPGWKLLRQYRYAHRGYHDKPDRKSTRLNSSHNA